MAKQNTAPTMKDVAKEAGVSLGTVSKVINGIPVGDEYRKKVEQAIKTLDYHINAYAKGLKNNRTYTVAVILPTAAIGCCCAIRNTTTPRSGKWCRWWRRTRWMASLP